MKTFSKNFRYYLTSAVVTSMLISNIANGYEYAAGNGAVEVNYDALYNLDPNVYVVPVNPVVYSYETADPAYQMYYQGYNAESKIKTANVRNKSGAKKQLAQKAKKEFKSDVADNAPRYKPKRNIEFGATTPEIAQQEIQVAKSVEVKTASLSEPKQMVEEKEKPVISRNIAKEENLATNINRSVVTQTNLGVSLNSPSKVSTSYAVPKVEVKDIAASSTVNQYQVASLLDFGSIAPVFGGSSNESSATAENTIKSPIQKQKKLSYSNMTFAAASSGRDSFSQNNIGSNFSKHAVSTFSINGDESTLLSQIDDNVKKRLSIIGNRDDNKRILLVVYQDSENSNIQEAVKLRKMISELGIPKDKIDIKTTTNMADGKSKAGSAEIYIENIKSSIF